MRVLREVSYGENNFARFIYLSL